MDRCVHLCVFSRAIEEMHTWAGNVCTLQLKRNIEAKKKKKEAHVVNYTYIINSSLGQSCVNPYVCVIATWWTFDDIMIMHGH